MRNVIRSEWTKVLSTRTTAWTLPVMFVLTVGLGFLLALAASHATNGYEGAAGVRFAAFASVMFGQLVLIVFGVSVIGSEFSTGSLRTSLTAVPNRGRFYLGKLIATGALATAVAVPTVFATFYVTQWGLGGRAVSLGEAEMLPALLGAVAYLPLICLFAFGLTALLRSSTIALSIVLPVMFLDSQGLSNLPAIKPVAQYLPSSAGMSLMRLVPVGDPRFSHDFGPWGGGLILLGWAVLAVAGGYLVLRRREP